MGVSSFENAFINLPGANSMTEPTNLTNNPPSSNRQFSFRPDAWPDNAIHVSLDLETASTAHNAAIIQLAAASSTGRNFNEYVSVADCEAFGMHICVETLQWWDKQDPELRAVAFGGTNSISDTITNFLDWCQELCEGDWDRIYLWGNGVDFDVTILLNAIEIFGKSPFNFRNSDHIRTLKRAVPIEVQQNAHDHFVEFYNHFQPHDALGDATYQLQIIRYGTNWLRTQDNATSSIL